jgi:cytochrome c oxidase cbb3-type subunit 3/ubiquinol-cytochrome c reductase cytochrome c subunit
MLPLAAGMPSLRSLALIVQASCVCVALAACSRSQPAAPPPPQPATPQAAPAPSTGAATPAQAPPVEDPAVQQAAAIAHGAELYKNMCAVCHGPNGEGYKADQATALAQPDFLASASEQHLGFAIAEGRPGTTMSAWYKESGGPLNIEDIRAIVAYLRSWQKTPQVKLDESGARGDVARGKTIYTRECERCHAVKGPNVHIMGRHYLARVTLGFLRHALHTGRPPTPMQSYTATLGETGIEDVVAYLHSLPAFPDLPAPTGPPPPIPLGPVPLNPKGREPRGFSTYPEQTSLEVVGPELKAKARMILLDARVPSDYEREHITGAVSVPFYDPAPYLDKLPKNGWMVAYCACPHAESGMLAEKLMAAGFKKVTILREGLFAWQERGFPIAHGRNP